MSYYNSKKEKTIVSLIRIFQGDLENEEIDKGTDDYVKKTIQRLSKKLHGQISRKNPKQIKKPEEKPVLNNPFGLLA